MYKHFLAQCVAGQEHDVKNVVIMLNWNGIFVAQSALSDREAFTARICAWEGGGGYRGALLLERRYH